MLKLKIGTFGALTRTGARACDTNYTRGRGEVARVGKVEKKYEEKVSSRLPEIAEWTRQGATIKEIAGLLGVAYSTLRKYLDEGEKGKELYAPLWRAYEQAKEEPNRNVEAALYKKTQGYNAKVAKNFKIRKVIYDPATGKKVKEEEELVTAYDEVHVPADTKAIMFWLTNNNRERWKYKPEEEESDERDGGVVMLAPVAEEEK